MTASPMQTGVFTVRQVAALFGLSERQLRYWSQTGFIAPSVREGPRSFYSFRDLVSLRVAKALLDGGLPLRRVRRSLAALARDLPEGDASLASVRVRCEGDQVVVERPDHAFEPATGQLVFDFDVATLQRDAADVLALPWVSAAEDGESSPSTAYDWFLHGCDLEDEWGGSPSDRQGFEDAKRAYGRALALDPELAAAWTNLGSMYAEVGELDEATEHYRKAIAADPDQPEAHCNLAELALRTGQLEQAVNAYREVVRMCPDWSEGHYGLARALLAVGGKAQALAHLERFCHAAGEQSDPEMQIRRERAGEVVKRLRAELGEGH